MNTPDWDKIGPSSSPALTRDEAATLPVGMVVLRRFGDDAWTPCHLVSEGFERDAPAPVACGMYRHQVTEEEWSPPLPLWMFGLEPEIRLPRLPRLSFAMTTDAVRERRKTVTRRLAKPSWWKEGAWFLGVDKIRQAGAQGLCIGRCGLANKEPLVAISQSEVDREGFPHTTPEGFIAMFRGTAPREWDGWVWRMPFTYLEIPT